MSELVLTLQKISALRDVPDRTLLKQLVNQLRVTDFKSKQSANQADAKIQELIEILQKQPDLALGFSVFMLKLLSHYRQIPLYTDMGISSDRTFFQSIERLIGHRFLPLLPQEDSIVELVAYLFDHKHDERWLASIDSTKWDTLVSLLHIDNEHLDIVATTKNNILNAMVILSYRISGIGLHPELMDAYPQILNYSAAFVAQNQEAILFVNEYRRLHELDALTDVIPDVEVDPAPLLVMIEQCEDIVNTIRKRIYKTGISIRLTNMMLRLEQSLKRLRILTELVSNHQHHRNTAMIDLIQGLVITAKHRYSFGYLIDNNTKLLSKKVTENASRVGEHYISTDKSGYQKMFQKASIGGFFIAFMATMKILAYGLVLAPIGRAFVNSMIYGLGFVFIHIIHGTVATKQPAMTAAAIASTISDGSGKKSHQLTKLSELIVDILRTQFIAIMGNVLIAMPMAFLISWAWFQYFGHNMINVDKALHLLHELDPIHSLALPHAAIAGVFLFLSGLISGYYDNLAVYNKIGERLRHHWLLLKIMPTRWLQKMSTFIEGNLGAIMGNFLFGVFLGSTATVGHILGLPLDIRHIAFSSANFAHGMFNLPTSDFSLQLLFISLLGVVLIGVVNLMVSFSLALFVALRSKDVQFFEWGKLARLLFNHLTTHPLDFFIPRPKPMKYAHINSQGDIIFENVAVNRDNKLMPNDYVMRRLPEIKKQLKKANLVKTDDTVDLQDFSNTKTTEQTPQSTEAKMNKIALEKPDNPPRLPD